MSWSDPCPARGPGLPHVHWRDCEPPGVHPPDPGCPGAGRVHQYAQCCYCEERIAGAQQASEAGPADVDVADHLFMPTLGNRCARPDCQRTRERHPTVLEVTPSKLDDAQAVAQAELHGLPAACTVNHAQIAVRRLVGDGGEVWTSCPQCGVVLEPKLTTGEYGGKKWGHGRGEATPRFLARIEGYVGWFRHRFGQGS